MFRRPAVRRLYRWIPRFAASERGNVAILFALFLVPVITFIGMAIDYGRAARARSAMQNALDSTALMLSRDLSQNTISASDIETKANEYFKALYTDAEAQGVTVNANYSAPTSNSASGFNLTASGHIISDFMQLAGYPTLGFGTKTATQWGNAKLRVALVLDNTGSMQGTKLSTLKTVTAGAGGLIDQLSVLARNPDDVMISLVPFARVVNVAGSGINSDAIVGAGWATEPTSIIPANFKTVGPNGNCPFVSSSSIVCIDENTGGALPGNKIATSGKICPQDTTDKGRYAGCWDTTGTSGNYVHTWQPFKLACIADRDPYKTSSDTPAVADSANPFPAYINNDSTAVCPPNGNATMQPVLPLSSNWSALKSAINGMVATGNTDQGIGFQVGVQTLIPGGAFDAPAEADGEVTSYQRYIILLSDGLNTMDRWSKVTNDAANIDPRQKALCQAINDAKDANNQPLYTVYTIQLDTDKPASGVSTVLKNCASPGGQFYYLTNASQLGQVFQDIGNAIGKLRLTN